MLIAVDRLSVEVVTLDPAFRHLVKPVVERITQMSNCTGHLVIIEDDESSRSLVAAERLRGNSPDAVFLVVSRRGASGSPMLYRNASIVPRDGDLPERLFHAALLSLSGLTVRPPEAMAPDAGSDGPARVEAEGYGDDEDYCRLASLSPMERRVLRYLAEAMSNKEIGRCLSISDNTVRIHMRSIFLKLGAQNRTQAALLATRYRHTHVLDDALAQPPRKGVVIGFPTQGAVGRPGTA